jgi:hypothetical protein
VQDVDGHRIDACEKARTAERARNPERRAIPNGAQSRTAQNPEGRNDQQRQRRDTAAEGLRNQRHSIPPWRHAFCNLDVLDAAERAADLVNALIDRATRPRLLHAP